MVSICYLEVDWLNVLTLMNKNLQLTSILAVLALVLGLVVGWVFYSDKLPNTFRDTKLLFSIDYPRDWVVTDYIDYDKNGGCVVYKAEGSISERYGKDIRESCGEGTELVIANRPTPYPGWSVDNPPPVGYMRFLVQVRPTGSVYKDGYQDEDNVVRKQELHVGDDNNLSIVIYDYKDDTGVHDMALPTAVAYYYGSNYLYEFYMPRWGPNSPEEIKMFETIVSSFEEIK